MAIISVFGKEENDPEDLSDFYGDLEGREFKKMSLFGLLLQYSQSAQLTNDVSGDILITSEEHSFHFEMNPSNFMEWKLTIKPHESSD